MAEPIPPLLIISPQQQCEHGRNNSTVKGLVSSLLRSLFSGRIRVLRSEELPLFKIERSAVEEIFLSPTLKENNGAASSWATQELLLGTTRPEPRQWVIIAEAVSMSLRNIDHLIPPDRTCPYAPPELDFYWAQAGKGALSSQMATPGLWAVRGEHLQLVLERLKEAWSKESGAERVNEEEIWTRVVHELPLRKRAFEKGEVVAPRIGAVDWEAVSNAAFVTVPDWPEKEAWKFLQALYFGTYLGDETGMMLNILEA